MRKPGFQLGLGRLLWPVVLAVLGFGAAAPAVAQGGTTLLGFCMRLSAQPITDDPPPQMDAFRPMGNFHPGDIISFTLAPVPGTETILTDFSWAILTRPLDDLEADPQVVARSHGMDTLTYKVPAGALTEVGYQLYGSYGDVVMTIGCQPPVMTVSTLGEWSLILMGLLAVGLGIRQMRRLQ